MTHTPSNTISASFALKASSSGGRASGLFTDLLDAPFSTEDIPCIGEVVAAILSEKHALSAEQLTAFEALLDAPEMDSEKRQELLQAIWNIVVCLIDYQWKYAGTAATDREEACGSIHGAGNQAAEDGDNQVEWSQSDFGRKHNEASVKELRQKGDHDSQ